MTWHGVRRWHYARRTPHAARWARTNAYHESDYCWSGKNLYENAGFLSHWTHRQALVVGKVLFNRISMQFFLIMKIIIGIQGVLFFIFWLLISDNLHVRWRLAFTMIAKLANKWLMQSAVRQNCIRCNFWNLETYAYSHWQTSI